jgi:hypothetical protein
VTVMNALLAVNERYSLIVFCEPSMGDFLALFQVFVGGLPVVLLRRQFPLT